MMSKFKVEDGIPLPPNGSGRSPSEMSSAIKSMLPGQSILFDEASKGKAMGYISYIRKKGGKFATRKVEGGTRIWRLE